MILIIDNYDSFTYNLFQYVSEFFPEVEVVRNDKISVKEVEEMRPDGIILSPGPGKPEDAGICVELVQKLSPEIPILGVCLGHQAIVKAFGGDIIQCEEIVHGKKTHIFHRGKKLFEKMPLPMVAGRYHSLIAKKETLPKELQIDAENDAGIIMAISHEKFPCYGVQFHPESILTQEGKILMQKFLKICGIALSGENAC